MIDESKNERGQPAVADEMTCPMCGATIAAASRRCASCGENIPTSTPRPKRRFYFSPIEWIVVFAIIAVMVALLLPAVQRGGYGEGRRFKCKNNLKQIGLALHQYHEEYGSFPPAYIADESGRPMHSWRVLILPFLEQKQLYDEYQFDEPWDGPHNSQLANRSLDVFSCPTENHESGRKATPMTSYVAVIGPETVWPGDKPTKIGDVTDDISSTLQVVEIANSGIHWMEPRDLHILQMAAMINPKAGQGSSSRHIGGAQVLFADGSVRFLSEKLPATTIQALLTRGGGETLGEF